MPSKIPSTYDLLRTRGHLYRNDMEIRVAVARAEAIAEMLSAVALLSRRLQRTIAARAKAWSRNVAAWRQAEIRRRDFSHMTGR
ncbi:MAG TPA: hypothetical protein VFO41_16460 [Alphaproteobacteria bacterium]|nr:hypothetical protein [Alphaproteobacteria bacterium]